MSVFKGAIKKTKMRKNTFAQKLIIPPKPETAFLMLVIYSAKGTIWSVLMGSLQCNCVDSALSGVDQRRLIHVP